MEVVRLASEVIHLERLQALRKKIHMNPELKYEEVNTARLIVEHLDTLNIPYEDKICETGIVATIHGIGRDRANPGRAIGLRADMDALPMQEHNRFEHVSQVAGKMHACGHDGHVCMLLGAAELLASQNDFDGTVHLIFQPAEEGGAGAKAMMEAGLFEKYPCDAIFALHNWPELPYGQMAVRPGPIMGASVRFEIIVTGKGGHGALPHEAIDPIPIACAIVSQLQTLISRSKDPQDAAVLTVGKIESGIMENIIPDEAKIFGTCRTLTAKTQAILVEGLHRVSTGIAQAHAANAQVKVKYGYPATNNDAAEATFMFEAMKDVVGPQAAHFELPAALTAEDFAYMLESVPGAYGWIGNNMPGQEKHALHSPSYDFCDNNLLLGAAFWGHLVRKRFGS
ncbi:amidohydrolase [Advenella kashmirensis]